MVAIIATAATLWKPVKSGDDQRPSSSAHLKHAAQLVLEECEVPKGMLGTPVIIKDRVHADSVNGNYDGPATELTWHHATEKCYWDPPLPLPRKLCGSIQDPKATNAHRLSTILKSSHEFVLEHSAVPAGLLGTPAIIVDLQRKTPPCDPPTAEEITMERDFLCAKPQFLRWIVDCNFGWICPLHLILIPPHPRGEHQIENSCLHVTCGPITGATTKWTRCKRW